MEVINRTNAEIQLHQHAKFNTLDYDLWVKTQQVINGLPFAVKAHHVKIHRDDVTKLDDLSTEAYWNVMINRKAKRYREQNQYILPAHFIRASTKALSELTICLFWAQLRRPSR